MGAAEMAALAAGGAGDIFTVALKLPPPTESPETPSLRAAANVGVDVASGASVAAGCDAALGLGLGLCEDAVGRPRVSGFLRSHRPARRKSASKFQSQAGQHSEEVRLNTAMASEPIAGACEARRDKVTKTGTGASKVSHVHRKQGAGSAGLTQAMGPAEASGSITPGDHLLAVEGMPLAAFISPALRVQRCFYSLPCDGMVSCQMKTSISGSIGSNALINTAHASHPAAFSRLTFAKVRSSAHFRLLCPLCFCLSCVTNVH